MTERITAEERIRDLLLEKFKKDYERETLNKKLKDGGFPEIVEDKPKRSPNFISFCNSSYDTSENIRVLILDLWCFKFGEDYEEIPNGQEPCMCQNEYEDENYLRRVAIIAEIGFSVYENQAYISFVVCDGNEIGNRHYPLHIKDIKEISPNGEIKIIFSQWFSLNGNGLIEAINIEIADFIQREIDFITLYGKGNSIQVEIKFKNSHKIEMEIEKDFFAELFHC